MLKTLNNKIIVEKIKNEKTQSGLVIKSEVDTDSIEAIVVCVSEENENKVKIGDKVILSKFSGNKIIYKNREYLVLDFDSVLAVVEEE